MDPDAGAEWTDAPARIAMDPDAGAEWTGRDADGRLLRVSRLPLCLMSATPLRQSCEARELPELLTASQLECWSAEAGQGPAGGALPGGAPDDPDAGVATVYVDGVFDLFHPGHLAFLRQAKGLGGPGARLVVGVISDEDARWKREPIMTHAERLAMLRACVHVDRVVDTPPLVVTAAFLDSQGADFAVHGDDDWQERYFGDVIAAGRMRYVPYTPGVSTTQLIARAALRVARRAPPGGEKR